MSTVPKIARGECCAAARGLPRPWSRRPRSRQYHEHKEETIHLLSGEAVIKYGAAGGELTERTFRPGDTIHLPARAIHRVTAVTDVVLAEASTAFPGWRDDVVMLEDAYHRTGTSAP